MAEKHIWTSTPSQVVNLGKFLTSFILFCIIAVLNVLYYQKNKGISWLLITALFVPIVWSVWSYLAVKFTKYELTTQRLKQTRGVFNLVSEELELYRIKDHLLKKPWYFRPFNLGNIILITADKADKNIVLKAMRNSEARRQDIRDQKENARK